MNAEPGWTAYTGDELDSLPPEIQQQIMAARQQEPIAEVTLKLYGLEAGQSELQLRISPHGPLHQAHGSGDERQQAYAALLLCLERELAAGVAILRDAPLP